MVGTARVCHFQGRVLLTDYLLRPADLPYGTALGTVLRATGFSTCCIGRDGHGHEEEDGDQCHLVHGLAGSVFVVEY